jgi:uroporphyrinogen III methyltransferase/synthase
MATGKVYLVGAGPGDPGLISLRAVECLQRADVVLYDGLVNPLVLRHAHATCERTCRSSSPDGRILKQHEINERLVKAAKAGNTVVRLKGGDPFIFGRGSEEAAYLRKHGIDFEIVPGITAAVAAGEYAGLSLTHRDHASMVTFITGHESPDKSGSALDYALLAKLPGTIVFYMGLHRLPQIAEALIVNGKSAETPTAVISRATTPLQRTVTANLGAIAAEVARAQLVAPSLIIVGECVRQRDELAWFEQRPLFGLRIGITRPEAQASPQISRAIELGAQPVLMPLIGIRPTADTGPLDAALGRLDEFDWLVFTSANGVDAFFNRLWETGRDARSLGKIQCAAIGPSTAEALGEFRVRADVVPDEYRAEGLAAALAPLVAGKRVLWPRANRGRDVLPSELTAAGATVEQVVVYDNADAASLPDEVLTAIKSEQLDWIALSSPSIARSLAGKIPFELQAKLGTTTKLATISPVTSQAAREAGLPVSAEAETFTWDGIFEAIQNETVSN